VGATPSFYLKLWANRPRWSEIADFEPIFACSVSAVTHSENRKSTTCFQMSLRLSSYVVPKSPKGIKTQNGRFRYKIVLRLTKVCYKVSLCKNCKRQSCKAFIGLTIRAKMIGGRPLLPKIVGQSGRVGANVRSIFACSASAVTPREKSSINTNRKSTTRFPISPR